MSDPRAQIRITSVHPKMGTDELPWPTRKSDLAAGYDLAAAIDEPIDILPGMQFVCPLGFAMAMPPGIEAQIRPRSGIASKTRLSMPNSPGTIDADYRGEVKAILRNDAPATWGAEGVFRILPGMRIAQMVISRLPDVDFEVTANLDDAPTDRGSGGFGSTGTN